MKSIYDLTYYSFLYKVKNYDLSLTEEEVKNRLLEYRTPWENIYILISNIFFPQDKNDSEKFLLFFDLFLQHIEKILNFTFKESEKELLLLRLTPGLFDDVNKNILRLEKCIQQLEKENFADEDIKFYLLEDEKYTLLNLYASVPEFKKYEEMMNLNLKLKDTQEKFFKVQKNILEGHGSKSP